MARKRKEQPIVENVKIENIAAEGMAIAHLDDGMVVFVPYAAPGDVADVKLLKRKKRHAQGVITKLVEAAPEGVRTTPRCQHFGTCGGCKWQHLDYGLQLKCKQQQVVDAMQHLGGLQNIPIEPIVGADPIYGYRNKLEYTFSNRKWIPFEMMGTPEAEDNRDGAGFHISGAFDKVLDVNRCHLQDDISNQIRLFVRDYGKENGFTFFDLRQQTGLLRTMMVRTASTGETMVLMVFGEDNPQQVQQLMDAIRGQFPQITSLLYTINTKANDTFADLDIITHSGKPFIEEQMEGRLKFRIGPKSFYQTNSAQAEKLYATVREFAGLTGNELVYDLYTGTGTIAQFIARDARRVIGVEYVPEAIEDAKINAEVNGIADKTTFIAGDMKDILTDRFIAENGLPDVMIVDPPRAGMHPDVVETILRAQPRRLVYVSCNPATQARDLALLTTKYTLQRMRPVDMFPHTAHVENVALLTLTT